MAQDNHDVEFSGPAYRLTSVPAQIFKGAAIGSVKRASGFVVDTDKPANGAGVILINCASSIAEKFDLDIRHAMQLVLHQVASNTVGHVPFDHLKERVEASFEDAADYLRVGTRILPPYDHKFYAVYLGMDDACQQIAEIS